MNEPRRMFINDGEYVQLDAYQELERQLAEARKLIKDYRKDHSDDASEWSIERGPCDMESDDEGIMDHRCSMCKVADDEMLINAPQGKEPHDC